MFERIREGASGSSWRTDRQRRLVCALALAATLCASAGTAVAQQANEPSADEQELDAEPVTLTQLLEFAGDHAPQVEQARARLGLGDAAIEDARRFQQFNPEIEGELGVGLEDVGISRVEVTLKQRFEIGGERGLRLEAARKRKQALVAEFEQAEWGVHQQVHRLYRAGLVDRQRMDIERDVLGFTRRLLDIAKERFEAGEEPETSVIVARAEVAKARQRLLQARLGYVRTLRNLGAAVGWTKEAPPQPTGRPREARPVPSKQTLVEKAIEEDPQLDVLQARLEQAQSELALAERKVWPNPVFGVGYERENLGSTAVENKLRFVVGVPLPLWNQNEGEIAAAKTRTDIISQAIESRKKVLESRVLEEAEAVQTAYRQAQIYQEEVLPALEAQLQLLQEGFKLGELSLLDVMNARDRLLEVQRQHLAALTRYYAAVSELEQLLGTAIWNENTEK